MTPRRAAWLCLVCLVFGVYAVMIGLVMLIVKINPGFGIGFCVAGVVLVWCYFRYEAIRARLTRDEERAEWEHYQDVAA